MHKNTKTILEMVEKHGRGLAYMGKCSGYKGQYVILHEVAGEYKVYLATKTQKEMIEKLLQVI